MNKWTYLLVYHPSLDSERVKKFLDSRPEILNWHCYIPNTFLIVSNKTADTLMRVFRKFTRDKSRFIILDTQTDRNGWLPQAAWALMREPKSVEEE